MTKRAEGWDVVDIHTPMRKALDDGRAKNPAFVFSRDGVHPGREGHWLMASEILTQLFGANVAGIPSADKLFPANGEAIRNLVRQRQGVLFSAWMTQIGHQRPGVPGGPKATPGPTVDEATQQAAAIGKQIEAQLAAKP